MYLLYFILIIWLIFTPSERKDNMIQQQSNLPSLEKITMLPNFQSCGLSH